MDPRLSAYYQDELRFIRESAREFAEAHPKIAGRLGLDRPECDDPYVERLLEGFAYLAARVQLQISREFPRFAEQIFEAVYPNYLAPVPSMLVAQLRPTLTEDALGRGVVVPRGTVLRMAQGRGDRVACEFRTAHDVTLWPLELTEAQYLGSAGALAAAGMALAGAARAGIRLRLRSTAGLRFADLALEELSLYLQGATDLPTRLYEEIVAHGVGVVVQPRNGEAMAERFGPASIRRSGFDDSQALLPVSRNAFKGYRLLQEYFAFPQRFLFVDLTGIGRAVRRCPGTELEVVILLDRAEPQLGTLVTADCFQLNCTPAVNLLPRKAVRIPLQEGVHEYHVAPDRARTLDYEVYSVLGVTGYGRGTEPEQQFLPFHAATDHSRAERHLAYYSCRREPRVAVQSADHQRRAEARSGYWGTEVYVSLVDGHHAPVSTSLKQIEVSTLCTNRDLPTQFTPGSGTTDFTWQTGAPLTAVRCLAGPSRPLPSRSDGDVSWRLLSQLSLNYLSIVEAPDGQGAVALRELLSLYAHNADPVIHRQIEGIRQVASGTITRRIPTAGPVTYGRGLEITLTLEDAAYEGMGTFLLGAVLDEFFARYATINSFTETVVRTHNRGEVMRWPARLGRRQAL
jgi:type VI secretion system protein ImpG